MSSTLFVGFSQNHEGRNKVYYLGTSGFTENYGALQHYIRQAFWRAKNFHRMLACLTKKKLKMEKRTLLIFPLRSHPSF